jgi:hypothetical protein
LNYGAEPSKSVISLAGWERHWVIADLIKDEIMKDEEEGVEWVSGSEWNSESDSD